MSDYAAVVRALRVESTTAPAAMAAMPEPLAACEALAAQYRCPFARRAVYRAAAAVRLQFANEADDPLVELRLVAAYERKSEGESS